MWREIILQSASIAKDFTVVVFFVRGWEAHINEIRVESLGGVHPV